MHAALTSPAFLKGARVLKFFADMMGVLLFLTAFSGFAVQIFYRYVMNDPLLWTEEFTMIAFIWTVFWAAAFMVPIREHVSFDVVYEAVSEKVRRVFAIIAMLVLMAAFLLLIPATFDYLDFLTRKKSPVIRLPMHWIYGCYMLFLCGLVIQAFWRLAALCSPKWREQL